jgi:hypothetical protein
MNRTDRLVARAIEYLQPCPDVAVERVLYAIHKTPPSTVRGARKRLERRGLVRCAGHFRDGVKKWELAAKPAGSNTNGAAT